MKSRNFIKLNILCLNMQRYLYAWLVFFLFFLKSWTLAKCRFKIHVSCFFLFFFFFFYISEPKFFLWRENFKLIFFYFLNDCNSKKKKFFMGTMLEIKCPRICVHLWKMKNKKTEYVEGVFARENDEYITLIQIID